MDNQKKKTPPKRIHRISVNEIADPKNSFIGVLDGKVTFIGVNNQVEESEDDGVECDTYTIRGEEDYERKFKSR